MATQPLSPAEHYAAAERLVAAAEGSVTEEIQTTSALIALVHALLAQAPRRARRTAKHTETLPPALSWGDGQ